ncbi:MAG: hypothetical protein AAF599_19780, partial [Bacteroidota bacterium]
LALLITSCQKETIDTATKDQLLVTPIKLENDLDKLNDSANPIDQLQSNSKQHSFLYQVRKKEIENEKRDKVTKARTRRRADTLSSSSSCIKEYSLNCGTYFVQGSTEADITDFDNATQNINGENFYSRMGFNASFEGNEKSYYFVVEEETLVKFSLLGLSNPLAMILLEAEISCDVDNEITTVTERYLKVVSYDNAFPNRTNQLGPVRLQPGQYVLVIDSQSNKGSDFLLNVQCQEPRSATTCGTNSLFYESFALYDSNEDISNQSSYWEKWSPEAEYDGIVACCDATFNKVLGIVRRPTDNANQPNVLFTVGERNSGDNDLEFYFGMPRGYSGYFSIQKFLTERNANNEEGAKFFFRETGKGSIEVGGRTIDFNYPNGFWMKLRLEFDFDNDKSSFYIGNDLIGQWNTSDTHTGTGGIQQVEALNFYPFYSNSLFFAERFCFSD